MIKIEIFTKKKKSWSFTLRQHQIHSQRSFQFTIPKTHCEYRQRECTWWCPHFANLNSTNWAFGAVNFVYLWFHFVMANLSSLGALPRYTNVHMNVIFKLVVWGFNWVLYCLYCIQYDCSNFIFFVDLGKIDEFFFVVSWWWRL